MTNPSDDRARQAEAEAILRRVRQETEPQTGAAAESMARGLRRHFLAGDADPADRMEVIGTRIGRLAGSSPSCSCSPSASSTSCRPPDRSR